MMNLARRFGIALLLAGLAAFPARAELIYGLTADNGLVRFDSASPGSVSDAITISGVGTETILDIDIRPANGLLYGLGSAGNLYSIDTTTGLASLSATLGTALSGERFGIDFNPVVDRLRIISDTGQNLRLTPGTSVTTVDGNLNGAATGAVSVAYTNNDSNPTTGTVLFYIGPGTSPDTLFRTSLPNAGILTAVGALGQTSSLDVGFDISGATGIAYASLTNPTGGGSSLYTIDLATGAATLVGGIGNGLGLLGIAAPVAVPEPASLAMLGLGLVGAIGYARRRRAR